MAATCGTCGEESVLGARFCHSCGARIDGVLVDLDLDALDVETGVRVHSEPDGRADRSSRGPLLGGLALVALLALGFSAVASGDDPDGGPLPEDSSLPDPDPRESSTTTEPETDPTEPGSTPAGRRDVVSLGSLDWAPELDLGAVWPIAILEHDDHRYLFASGGLSFYGFSGPGLWAWRSVDGVEWQALGPVLGTEVSVAAVAVGPRGFVAAGTGRDEEPTVWRSDDGVEWDGRPLPGATGDAVPSQIATNTDTDVVIGEEDRSALPRFAEEVGERFGVDLGRFGFASTPDSVTVLGPFGLRMAEISLAELGIDERDDPFGPPGSPSSPVAWASIGGDAWDSAVLDEGRVSGLTTAPDGDFLLRVHGESNSGALLRSVEGITWTETTPTNTAGITRWGDRLVGRSNTNTPRLDVSPDGVDWDTVDLGDLVSTVDNPSFTGLTAGSDGIVATVHSFGPAPEPVERTATLLEDGFALTAADGLRGGLTLSREGVELTTTGRDPSVGGDYTADLAAGTVTFIDPDTSDPLVTFTVDELRMLESSFDTGGPSPSYLLVSIDAESWWYDRVDTLVEGGGGFPGLTRVVDGRVHAVITEQTGTDASGEWRMRLFGADLETDG